MSSAQQPSGGSATRAFFGAIKENIRGRSRSRSPAPTARQTEATDARVQQPEQQAAVQKKPKRPSPTPVNAYRTTSQSTNSTTRSSSSTDRSDWHRVSYGRHSTDWIFTSQKNLKRQSTSGSSQYSS